MQNRLYIHFFVLMMVILLSVTMGYAQRIYGGMYSAERIANLRVNCNKYEWGQKLRSNAIQRAKNWLTIDDKTLWAMAPGQDLPRCIDVSMERHDNQATQYGCLVCGAKILKYGNYPYEPDCRNKPWKITCPSCGSVFPTNDFGKYYQSGIDDKGLFNPAKANRSLLYNTDHPDPKDPLHTYGVDDSFGYNASNGHNYKFIGYYTYKYWHYLFGGLTALADAYLYTGNAQYAHKAAIMLDRIADVYPDMDWKPYADRGWYHSDGGSNLGKIEGSIWENFVVQALADNYDKILSGTLNDPKLYGFLNDQAKKYHLPSQKGSRALFVKNVDDGLLRTAYKAVLSKQIRGNQGMHQLALATCAIALNTRPETTQWLDWVFSPTGGRVPELMIANFDHDGTSDEGAPGYALFWGTLVTKLAGLLEQYPAYTKHNILKDFPHFASTFTTAYRMALFGKAIPNIGDSGATGLVNAQNVDPQFMALGYRYTHDPEIALAAYRSNRNSAGGLGRDIYAKDPDLISRDIAQIAKNAAPKTNSADLMTGFGLALLTAGKGTSQVGLACNYGRTIKHAHPDMLNFDIFAYDHWLAPDQGYPEFATTWPSNTEWTGSTLSHNTVFVNRQPQKEIWGGHTRLFKHLDGFNVVEIDGKDAYPGISNYTRTLFLIGADSNAYAIDIFRITGGNDHVYSFHGPPGEIKPDGLHLQLQQTGTYAGKDIEKGALAKGFPIGYSYLYHVQKDQAPPAHFMLDWKVTEPYRGLTDKDDVHLRMYALTPCDDVALANGDPPQNKPGNPRALGYMLMHRTGNNLNSAFVSVIEPYKSKPFIKSVKRIDDGGGNIILEITLTNGHTDHVIYNPSAQKTVKVSGNISMTGDIGYLREKNNKAVKGILINGTSLKYNDLKINSAGPITGKVVKMNKGLTGDGWLLVNTKQPLDNTLIGQQIMVSTTSNRDACYKISSIEKSGRLTKITCGPISFVRGVKHPAQAVGPGNYLYDFEEGAAFNIPVQAVWNIKQKN